MMHTGSVPGYHPLRKSTPGYHLLKEYYIGIASITPFNLIHL
jgi:hypothetical protein